VTRFGTASWIAQQVTQVEPTEQKRGIKEKIDDILLDPVTGPVLTLSFFVGLFGALLLIGNVVQYWLTVLFEVVVPTPSEASPLWFVLVEGLHGLTAGIAIALPYVFLFYLVFGLMEDVGLLSRFIVNLDRLLRKLKLPGKSFIPLALGLGCSAAATRATRVLSSKKGQFHTSMFFAFVPCSSRIAIIMGIVGFYGSTLAALGVFFTLMVAGVIWGLLVVRLTDIEEEEPLLIELPPYRRPIVDNVLAKSWIRMKDFVYIVLPLLMVGGAFYGLLKLYDIPRRVIEPLSPISHWLGLPDPTIVPLLFGVSTEGSDWPDTVVSNGGGSGKSDAPSILFVWRCSDGRNSVRCRAGDALEGVRLERSHPVNYRDHHLRIRVCWSRLENPLRCGPLLGLTSGQKLSSSSSISVIMDGNI
jgi:ferrous iron transport protein B